MSLNGLNTNYAVQNKWIGYVPLSVLATSASEQRKYSDIELYLTDFRIPQIELGSSSVSYKGYSVEVPTKVMNASTKEIDFNYIIDSQWLNYKMLYWWASGLGVVGASDASSRNLNVVDNAFASKLIPIRIYLTDPYKKKIIQFVFKNCWLCRFGELPLSYQDKPDEIKHTFTVKYSDFTIEDC